MRTALVTGPSSGIGRAAAIALARRGFHVIAAGRSPERVRSVVDAMAGDGLSAEPLHLDLSSLAVTQEAADRLVRDDRSIDVLINNAGVGVGRGVTADGFELHFGVNHLGHFMLTKRLLPSLSPGSRVVQVSSHMHYRAKGIDLDAVTGRTRTMLGLKEYAVSKLANVLFVRELARRRPDLGAYAAHPGFADTGIIPRVARPFLRRRLISPVDGADTVVWCATEPGLETGGYFSSRSQMEPSEWARDDDLAALLWRRSDEWCSSTADSHGN